MFRVNLRCIGSTWLYKMPRKARPNDMMLWGKSARSRLGSVRRTPRRPPPPRWVAEAARRPGAGAVADDFELGGVAVCRSPLRGAANPAEKGADVPRRVACGFGGRVLTRRHRPMTRATMPSTGGVVASDAKSRAAC